MSLGSRRGLRQAQALNHRTFIQVASQNGAGLWRLGHWGLLGPVAGVGSWGSLVQGAPI